MRRRQFLLFSLFAVSFTVAALLHSRAGTDFSVKSIISPRSSPEYSQKGHNLARENRSDARIKPRYAAVINFCQGERYGLLSQWAFKNHKDYSQAQDYDYFQGDSLRAPFGHFFTPPAWGKAALLWQVLDMRTEHEWFLLADCDALYMKLDESVEKLLEDLGFEPGPLGKTHVVVARDLGTSPFNTGVMLVRNGNWSRDFFADVLRLSILPAVREHPWWEQHAMQRLYVENKQEEHVHIGIVADRSRFNAFTVVRGEYKDNHSFVRHQVNCPGHPENNATTFEQCADNFAFFFCSRFQIRHIKECLNRKHRPRS
jgi:hypothetical protein